MKFRLYDNDKFSLLKTRNVFDVSHKQHFHCVSTLWISELRSFKANFLSKLKFLKSFNTTSKWFVFKQSITLSVYYPPSSVNLRRMKENRIIVISIIEKTWYQYSNSGNTRISFMFLKHVGLYSNSRMHV